jgi:hypothetical protein
MRSNDSATMTQQHTADSDAEYSNGNKPDETIQLTLAQVHAFTTETAQSDVNQDE